MIDLPPIDPPSVACGLLAAVEYQIPANLLLALRDVARQRQPPPNQSSALPIPAGAWNKLKAHGITAADADRPGCYVYELAAWHVRGLLREGRGDVWNRAADYFEGPCAQHPKTRLALMAAARPWTAWLRANFSVSEFPKPSAGRSAPTPLPGSVRVQVEASAARYDIDPALVLAVIDGESGGDPRARSPKNAQGLMQLRPDTAQRFGVADPWDIGQNIEGGTAYLNWLLRHFNGSLPLALAGYNAGEGAVERHGGIPPYRETRHYVQRIIGRYGKARHPIPKTDGVTPR